MSGNEGKFWLALAKDIDSRLVNEIEELMGETDELIKILGSSVATLKGKNKLGTINSNFELRTFNF